MEVQLEINIRLSRVQLYHQTANRHCKYMAMGLEAILFIKQFVSTEVSEPQLRKEIDMESPPSDPSY